MQLLIFSEKDLQKKWSGRNFCITHGTLCSRHVAQRFRPIASGESSATRPESDLESSLDLIATDHRLQINSHNGFVQTMTVNEASEVIEPPTVNVISSVIEGTSINIFNENLGFTTYSPVAGAWVTKTRSAQASFCPPAMVPVTHAPATGTQH